MRFSEVFSVVKSPQSDDWFDVLTHTDTPLFVDPFLVWAESDGFWRDAHSHLISFFDMVFDMISESGNNNRHISWRQASNLLLFPEPAEFRFGVAEGSPFGSGSGRGLQEDMLSGIQVATSIGMNRIAHVETIALFQGGMGVDRISDVVCNVLKSYFIQYTKEVAARHGVPTVRSEVPNASWSFENRRWVTETHELPLTEVEVVRRGRVRLKPLPVILTPQRFLRDIPIADSNKFWQWSWSQMSDQLRGDFNYDVASNVRRQLKARMARENPDAVALYLRAVEDLPNEPYPIDEDPRLLVSWYERGRAMIGTPAPRWLDVEESPASFLNFVSAVIDEYRHGVENDSWRLLWFGNRGAGERSAQVLFRSVVGHYCKANDVDLTGESNAGRGPVDFKFSKGWTARALVEIKLARHSSFWDGLFAQTPTYQIAEGVRVAFFVAVAYTEDEMSTTFQRKLREAASLVSRERNIAVQAVLVDATQKKSASKEKDPELREMLNELNDASDKKDEDDAS
jgi:hypothetical protein